MGIALAVKEADIDLLYFSTHDLIRFANKSIPPLIRYAALLQRDDKNEKDLPHLIAATRWLRHGLYRRFHERSI